MDVRAVAPPSFTGTARHFFVEVPAPSPSAVRAREEYHRRRQLYELQRIDTDSEEASSGSSEQQQEEEDAGSSEDDAEKVEELLRRPTRASVEAGQGRQPEGHATGAPKEDGQDGARSDDVQTEGNASGQDDVPASIAKSGGELLEEEQRHSVMQHDQATPAVSSSTAGAAPDGSDMLGAIQLGLSAAPAGPQSPAAAPESVSTGTTSTLNATDAVPDLRVDTTTAEAVLAPEQPPSAPAAHASINDSDKHPVGEEQPHQQQELGVLQSAGMTTARSRSVGASSSAASSSKKGGARRGSADGPDQSKNGQEQHGEQRKRLMRAGALAADSSSASPAAAAAETRSARGSPASARSSSIYETLDKLPMDTGISKILNRDLNAEGIYEYIVKLDDGSTYKVGPVSGPLFGRLLII